MSSSFDPIAELNGKIVRSRKIDFDELQCISIFGHSETDKQFKALTINDDDELKVNNGTGYLTKILTNGKVLLPTETYDSGTQKASIFDISILIIGQYIHDIIPTILISNNNVDYVGLDQSFYEDIVIGVSRQIRMNKFVSKHFKLNLTNINANSSNIKISYTYREH
jgi:hypothetical protein